MNEYSSKRAAGRLAVSKKGSALVSRDAPKSREQNAQFCNRIGCNGRLNSVRTTQNGCPEKPKSSRPSFKSSSSGKDIVGSSTRSCLAISSPRKPMREPRKKLSCHLETDSLEQSSSSSSSASSVVEDPPEVVDLIPSPGKMQRGHPDHQDDTSKDVVSPINTLSSSQRNSHRRSGSARKESGSLVSKNISQGVRQNVNTNRYGLKNLRCSSISDVIPSGCSSSDSSLNSRKEMLKRRNAEGESGFSSRGKTINPLENGQKPHHGISIPDSRQARNFPPNRDNGTASVRPRRPANCNHPRIRVSNQENRSNSLLNDSHVMALQTTEPEDFISLNSSSSPLSISFENHLSRPTIYSRPGSSESSRSRQPASSLEVSVTRNLMNRDSFRHYNMEGIAEILGALERMEQDEELTYEQLLSIETNLFLHGLSFQDQHRDMRLDIDNMSYEELLALEERMGNVSTALTEEAMVKCLRRSFYQPTDPKGGTMDFDGGEDDIKCSVCQEDYVIGDEVGRLPCDHRYHVVCIHQWLRQKNWCPICKSAAESTSPSSPTPSHS